MDNENETVEQVCAEMRSFGDVPPPMFAWRDLAERAEAAHKRELAAVSAERDEWQKQALEENAALDVARAELAAKDAEIASVMGDIKKLLKNGDLLCVQKIKMEHEIEKRNALIKELADAMKTFNDKLEFEIAIAKWTIDVCDYEKIGVGSLIKRACEIIGGGE